MTNLTRIPSWWAWPSGGLVLALDWAEMLVRPLVQSLVKLMGGSLSAIPKGTASQGGVDSITSRRDDQCREHHQSQDDRKQGMEE